MGIRPVRWGQLPLFVCRRSTRLSGGSLWPSVLPQMGSDSPVLRCPGTPDPEGPFPFPIFYREEPQAGSGRPADGTARARSATLQGSHSVATAELLAPLQDTVRCILKRKPPGRSGQPWSGSREQWSGREAPEMVKAQLRGKGQYSFLRPVCWTLQLPA